MGCLPSKPRPSTVGDDGGDDDLNQQQENQQENQQELDERPLHSPGREDEVDQGKLRVLSEQFPTLDQR